LFIDAEDADRGVHAEFDQEVVLGQSGAEGTETAPTTAGDTRAAPG
jgi:hypothetical protein